MAQALSAVHVHAVFSTKDREPLLGDEGFRTEMHHFLGGVSRTLGCPTIIVGGVADHVHILASLSRTISQADWIKELKRVSSKWAKERSPNFGWQSGYGMFSVSESLVPIVKRYIAEQEVHHQMGDFKEEFLALLSAHNLTWDEQYIWD